MQYLLPIYTKTSPTGKISTGQTLIEITIALAMSILLIVGFVSVMNVGLNSSSYASEKIRALRYAEEGIEKLRLYRDEQGWSIIKNSMDICTSLVNPLCNDNNFFNQCTENGGNCTTYNYRSDVSLPFTRSYQTVETSPYTVLVRVSWPTRSGQSNVDMYTVLTNWKYDTN